MLEHCDYREARDRMLSGIVPVGTERIPLTECTGRILAGEVRAVRDVPPFDRSAFDGYALRSSDTAGASEKKPAVLSVTDYIAAGHLPKGAVSPGCAARIMTGAPVPEGADAVIRYESTRFTEKTVEIPEEVPAGSNIVTRGEDVVQGQELAQAGTVFDPGLAGILASQGAFLPEVYRKVRVGIISTGDEVQEDPGSLGAGRIYDANRYSLTLAVKTAGCEPLYFGNPADSVREIAEALRAAFTVCDAVLLTGGVSAGDYDLTPDAMAEAGVEILARGLSMKPGMAGAYGVKDGKAVCALSGNPAACMTGYYLVVLPALRKLSGRTEFLLPEFDVRIRMPFSKKGKISRILRGRLVRRGGEVWMEVPRKQGNAMLHSFYGCDLLAEVPGGVTAQDGMVLRGIYIG